MGWLRKKGKQLRKGIKKIGKKIGKAFKSILKPFAKIFNKLGPLGTMAMMFILPGIGQMIAGWGAGILGGTGAFATSAIGQFAGHAVKFVGNAINFVATAPKKIFQTITGGITNAWSGLTGNVPAAGIDGSTGSWFGNFKADMQSTWTSSGITDAATGATEVGKGNWFDYSEQGATRLKNLGSDFRQMGTDIADVFKKDPRKTMTEATAESTFGKNSTEFADFMKNSGNTDYVLDRKGFFGNIRDVVGGTGSKIGDITVPGVGDVGDVANVSSMAMGAYSTLSQYGVVGSDDEVRGSSGMGLRAEEQLYAGDQGGIYNISAPTWSYDSSASTLQNQNNAMSAWNNNYGFPQGFDPSATPGYGFSYQQWLQEQMAA